MIYLDNAATTKTCREAVDAMLPYFTELYGNPSTIYKAGQDCKRAITDVREQIADTLGARPGEIYFTAGGSEADNWALKAAAEAYSGKGRHLITSRIEHHAVIHTCEYLERHGYEVTYLDVDKDGIVDLGQLEASIRKDTILISIMYANNEIGTIQPIKEIGTIAHQKGILFHTDAVAAYAHEPIDVDACHIDMLSASGHKLGGPKGVGFLYIRSGVKIRSFIHGGAQERSRRAGTENVPGIVGLGAAVKKRFAELAQIAAKEKQLRDYLTARIEKEIPGCILNGHRTQRLSNNVHFCFEQIDGEMLLILLDEKGICVSGGSACASGSLDPSHVLLAAGRSRDMARSCIRMTVSEENTIGEMDQAADALAASIKKLRNMPLP